MRGAGVRPWRIGLYHRRRNSEWRKHWSEDSGEAPAVHAPQPGMQRHVVGSRRVVVRKAQRIRGRIIIAAAAGLRHLQRERRN